MIVCLRFSNFPRKVASLWVKSSLLNRFQTSGLMASQSDAGGTVSEIVYRFIRVNVGF